MGRKSKNWISAFAVNFHRLTESEHLEIEHELLHDKDLNGLNPDEVHKAVVALKKSESYSGIRPTPYDLKREIIRQRGDADGSKSFKWGEARNMIRNIADPVERWNWIMDNTPETADSADRIIPQLLAYAESIPGGVKEPKLDWSFLHEVKDCKPEDEAEWDKKKREAHQKVKQIGKDEEDVDDVLPF